MPTVPTTSVGGSSGAMTQLFDSTLGGAAASFDITPIDGGYSHLRLILVGRDDNAGATTTQVRFNNDSGANYNSMQGVGQGGVAVGAPATSLGATSMQFGIAMDSTATANRANVLILDIPNYAGTTFHKTVVLVNSVSSSDAANGQILYGLANGIWKNTVAITRVTVFPSAGNWITGSRCSLYGIL